MFTLLRVNPTPSIARSLFFIPSPPWNPPRPPSDLTARWHGMMMGNGLPERAPPTAREPPGLPTCSAILRYVDTYPRGMPYSARSTLRWKDEHSSRATRPRLNLTSRPSRNLMMSSDVELMFGLTAGSADGKSRFKLTDLPGRYTFLIFSEWSHTTANSPKAV